MLLLATCNSPLLLLPTSRWYNHLTTAATIISPLLLPLHYCHHLTTASLICTSPLLVLPPTCRWYYHLTAAGTTTSPLLYYRPYYLSSLLCCYLSIALAITAFIAVTLCWRYVYLTTAGTTTYLPLLLRVDHSCYYYLLSVGLTFASSLLHSHHHSLYHFPIAPTMQFDVATGPSPLLLLSPIYYGYFYPTTAATIMSPLAFTLSSSHCGVVIITG